MGEGASEGTAWRPGRRPDDSDQRHRESGNAAGAHPSRHPASLGNVRHTGLPRSFALHLNPETVSPGNPLRDTASRPPSSSHRRPGPSRHAAEWDEVATQTQVRAHSGCLRRTDPMAGRGGRPSRLPLVERRPEPAPRAPLQPARPVLAIPRADLSSDLSAAPLAERRGGVCTSSDEFASPRTTSQIFVNAGT